MLWRFLIVTALPAMLTVVPTAELCQINSAMPKEHQTLPRQQDLHLRNTQLIRDTEGLFSRQQDELQGLINCGRPLPKLLLCVCKDLCASLAKATKTTARFKAFQLLLRTGTSNLPRVESGDHSGSKIPHGVKGTTCDMQLLSEASEE